VSRIFINPDVEESRTQPLKGNRDICYGSQTDLSIEMFNQVLMQTENKNVLLADIALKPKSLQVWAVILQKYEHKHYL
jgi:hypothetical protein